MPSNLDPRMVGTNVPLRVNDAVTVGLTATNASLTDINSTNVTSTNAVIDKITNTDFAVTNLTATNNVVSNFLINNINTSYSFNVDDNAKIYHFDTSFTPVITATFTNQLPNGFNVSIVNIGTGVIFLSAETTFNAVGQFNATQYTGVHVYKANDAFYGIGILE